MTQFTRNSPDPYEDLDIGNPTTRTKIVRVLRKMYKDYQDNKTIIKINEYKLTPAYLRKVLGAEVLVRTTKSKRDMQYKWNGGENPDYNALADQVLAFSTHIKAKKAEPDALNASKLSIILYKNGVEEDKIPQLTKDIIDLFTS